MPHYLLRGRTALFLPSSGIIEVFLMVLLTLLSRRVSMPSSEVKAPSPVEAAAACLPRRR
jgi:hypothetical protein